MARTETILQVFVASPSDVTEERNVLEEVIGELNNTWAETTKVRLELVKWETHAVPGFGDDAQDVINEQIPDSYDIFIGIMWTRFGTSTKRAGSGTEEEFLRAYRRHEKDAGAVTVMFYFKGAPVAPAELDPNQLRDIAGFRSRLGDLGGLYFQFDSVDEFRNLTRMHLSRVAQKWAPRPDSTVGKEVLTRPRDVVDTDKIGSVDDDEGFLDLIESAIDSMSSVTEVLERMSNVTVKLGERMLERGAEANKLSTAGGGQELKAVKRIAGNTARNLDDFVARMNVEIPLYSDAFSTSMDAFSRAATLRSDFGIDNTDDLHDTMRAIMSLRSMMKGSGDALASLRLNLDQIPPLTSVLNRARRNAKATLDTLLEVMRAGDRQAAGVETLLAELIEESKSSG